MQVNNTRTEYTRVDYATRRFFKMSGNYTLQKYEILNFRHEN